MSILLLAGIASKFIQAAGVGASQNTVDVTFMEGPMGLYLISGLSKSNLRSNNTEETGFDFPEGIWVTGFAKNFATGTNYAAESSGLVQIGDELIAVAGIVLGSAPQAPSRDTSTATRLIREHGYPITISFRRHQSQKKPEQYAWSHLLRSAESIRNNSTKRALQELHSAEVLMSKNRQRTKDWPIAYARSWANRTLRVVASLTTTPNRITHILPVLESLLNNPVETLDAVYLWVPMMLRRSIVSSPYADIKPEPSKSTLTGDALESTIPAHIKDLVWQHPGRFFVSNVVDLGPATKLVSMLEHLEAVDNNNDDTIILVADDDFLYSPLWAGELSHHSSPTQAAAVSTFNYTSDTALDKCWRYRAATMHQDTAHVVEAYLGVAVRYSMFGPSFVRELRNAADSDWARNGPWLLADDLIVSLYLRERGVQLLNIRTPLLERETAGISIDEKVPGLQDHHSTGISSRDEDECCTNRNTGHDFNCDANMRRYRKYLQHIGEFVAHVANSDRGHSGLRASTSEDL